MRSLETRQRDYFRKAYESGQHGWPVEKPTPFVARAIRKMLQRKVLASGSRVLDLGCGEGRHAIFAAEMGLSAVGLDYEPLAIRRARGIARRRGVRKNLRFVVGDAFRLPFRRERFDLIIDYGCLHHVRKRDTRRYLDSLLPRFAPGGRFLLSCFSWRFKHHPKERRTRDWLVHRGHYDRFFRMKDLREIFGPYFDFESTAEERDGTYAFNHVLMRRTESS